MREAVGAMVKALGEPKMAQVAGAVRADPKLAVLLRGDRLRADRGFRTAGGVPWQNLSVVRPAAAAPPGHEAMAAYCARIARLLDFLGALRAAFDKATDGDPERWRLVVLEGWWLKETVVQTPAGDVLVYLDGTCAFEPYA